MKSELADNHMIIYLRKSFKYLFHIFLKVLLKYPISFINHKALQKY
jgi:hypothetical protein